MSCYPLLQLMARPRLPDFLVSHRSILVSWIVPSPKLSNESPRNINSNRHGSVGKRGTREVVVVVVAETAERDAAETRPRRDAAG